ncbi:hypothetical protein M1446_02685 [Candidatus Dependentiae bacterium]|nr:hypothetical protein [Candidatus Dependentiae bacterium]
MKKLILNLFTISSIFCCEYKEPVSIVDYDASHKDAAMEIFFQDPMLFFGGSHLVTSGIMSREMFESENRKGMEVILKDSLRIKKVLINDGKVIGFINYFKTKEHSL